MWNGRRGLVMLILLSLVVLGMLWITWVGAPSQLFGSGNAELSRGKYHSRQASLLLWWVSECISFMTVLSGFAFIFTGAAFGFGSDGIAPSGRNYGRLAGIVGITGIALALLGTILSAS